ncbi:response regulator [Telluribacter sp.]|jgi:CheY-like chemotaxis protein|uniref:response regulator n=1 Tax=Telluribacter sp. TaxID=1978767 RepID=UPI002E0EB218|nr:response regulator [Telluribacter sp.]
MIKNLLIIDDDPHSVELTEHVVRDYQFAEKIKVLANGREGLSYFNLLATEPNVPAPELVILDLYMPIMNGWEFLDAFSIRYRDRFPQTCFCLLSASKSPEDKLKSLSYSCVIYLINKPIAARHLGFLEKFLQSRSQLFLNTGEKWE